MELSDEKLREIKEAFELYDVENKQSVGMTQLKSILLCLGIEASSNEINNIMEEYGESPSNINEGENSSLNMISTLKKISYSNFLLMMSKRNNESDYEDELMEAFRAFDKAGDGKLGFQEIRYILLCLGEDFSEEEINEIINQTDTSGKGYVDYQDFIKVLLLKNPTN